MGQSKQLNSVSGKQEILKKSSKDAIFNLSGERELSPNHEVMGEKSKKDPNFGIDLLINRDGERYRKELKP